MTFAQCLFYIADEHLPLFKVLEGDTPGSGRVLIFINGNWGTVCDDDWDLKDAEVFCKSLGYPGAIKALGKGDLPPGDPSRPIYFDNVDCNGDEAGVEYCNHNGVGNHNCDHDEDAGVLCLPRK